MANFQLPTSNFRLPTQRSCRAQVAIEFLMILSATIFFISIFLLAIQQNHQDKTYMQQNIRLKEVALTVQNEINLALESSEGYSREFQIPEKVGSMDYEITIDSGIVHIKTMNDKYAMALPIPEITGNINKTQNKIEKINGIIYLNQ